MTTAKEVGPLIYECPTFRVKIRPIQFENLKKTTLSEEDVKTLLEGKAVQVNSRVRIYPGTLS